MDVHRRHYERNGPERNNASLRQRHEGRPGTLWQRIELVPDVFLDRVCGVHCAVAAAADEAEAVDLAAVCGGGVGYFDAVVSDVVIGRGNAS